MPGIDLLNSSLRRISCLLLLKGLREKRVNRRLLASSNPHSYLRVGNQHSKRDTGSYQIRQEFITKTITVPTKADIRGNSIYLLAKSCL